MVIEKINFKVSKFDSDFTPGGGKSMSSDEDELRRPSSAVESDEDDDFDDADSGAGSDDFDLLELGETGVEFCQVGNQTCSIPFELYDLSGLEDVLSMDVWNECLSEDERFGLTRFLPDMDQETYIVTLKELFTGCNFHFGSPIKRIFHMLKGGLCEPRVTLYREGLNFFHRRQHYHRLRKHQNNLVSNICQIRDAWLNCRGYSIEERLRVLNIMRSQKSLMYEKLEDLETDLSEKESSEGLDRRIRKDGKTTRKISCSLAYGVSNSNYVSSQGQDVASAQKKKYVMRHPKGHLNMERLKMPSAMDSVGRFPSNYQKLDINSGIHGSMVTLSRKDKVLRYDSAAYGRDTMRCSDDTEEATNIYNAPGSRMDKAGHVKVGKRHELLRGEKLIGECFMDMPPSSKTGLHGWKKSSKLLSDMNVSATKPPGFGKKTKHPKNVQQVTVDEQKKYKRPKVPQIQPRGAFTESTDNTDSLWQTSPQGEPFLMDEQKKYKRPKAPQIQLKETFTESIHNTDSFWQNNSQGEPFMRDKQKKCKRPKVPQIQLKETFIESIDNADSIWHTSSQGEPSPMNEQKKYQRSKVSQIQLRGTFTESTDNIGLFWHTSSQGEPFPMDDWKPTSKRWKMDRNFPEISNGSYRSPSSQLNDGILHSEFISKQPQEKARGKFLYTEELDMSNGTRRLKAEETESDFSEQYDDDGCESDSNFQLGSKLTYPVPDRVEVSQSGRDARKVKNVTTKIGTPAERKRLAEGSSSKTKKKGKVRDGGSSKMRNGGSLRDASTSMNSLSGFGRFNDGVNGKVVHKTVKNDQLLKESDEKFHNTSKSHAAAGKLFGKAVFDRSVDQFKNLRDYAIDDDDDSLEMQLVTDDIEQYKVWNKVQSIDTYGSSRERAEVPLLGCNSVNKTRKGNDDMTELYDSDGDGDMQSKVRQIDSSVLVKKKSKRKLESDISNLEVETSEPPISDLGTEDMDQETKPQKKQFTLITPTVQTGFSFSIIHLLSAVRLAMITPISDDTLEVEKHDNNQEIGINGFFSKENASVGVSKHSGEINLPSLNIQEMVNRVRSNPGDPCILETQEPLQDLVRGVLKTFSSKTAPLGAKGWKTLSMYDKSAKSWSWVGPVPQSSSDNEPVEEVISPEAWGLPYKMVVKLVDSFANWLKSSQETLQQIGSLPAPPLALIQFNLDEKERFRDLRAQKSLNTINPSTEEVKVYFRREEVLRYSIPDRAFSYTAADGKKSIVAPLRRCGGKPTSKARDHFMLKRDRPPHITILCLVRDAAARLPGSIGTRADVCTLLRDSQYIVEDVSEAQVNQVVSGALDRLHYERDPCVQFDGDRKLWVYLHREREEEDFEDDGTSSTKKWKRQKKDTSEQSEQGTVSVAYPGPGEQSGQDLFSDLNIEPSCFDEDNKGLVHAFNDVRQNMDDNYHSERGELQQCHSTIWDALTLNPMEENKLLCQENSTNEDFDDEAFGRERSGGLLSATIL